MPSSPSPHEIVTGDGVNALIVELKTRARLRLNAMRRGTAQAPDQLLPRAGLAPRRGTEYRLRDCLNAVAREVGFLTWAQALRVLGGHASGTAGTEDMGTFWHAPRCNGLLSHWFASYDRARDCLAPDEGRVLVPYRRQFIVVDGHYLRELGLAPDDEAWDRAGRDLVQAYGGEAWLALCRQRLLALRDVGP
jgi:hypothetical protein